MIAESIDNHRFDCLEINQSGLMRTASNLLTRTVLEEHPRTVNVVLW